MVLITPEIEPLLQPLSQSIRSTSAFIERIALAKKASEAWPDDDWVVSEASVIDDSLGVAFVICQLYVNAVIAGLMFLHHYHARQTELAETRTIQRFIKMLRQRCWPAKRRFVPKLGRLSGERSKLLQRGSPLIKKGSPYTVTTAIEALANYFKHRDEWPNGWNDLQPTQRRTANVLQSIGLLGNVKGNLVTTSSFRDVFRQIAGRNHYENVGQLSVILEGWRDELKVGYQEEFKSLGIAT
jgi:hypothetical protein